MEQILIAGITIWTVCIVRVSYYMVKSLKKDMKRKNKLEITIINLK